MDGMMLFPDLFPEIGIDETRTLTVIQGDGELPPDGYGFLELYCVDPRCDCRRVLFNVFAQDRRAHVATISHAFEVPASDALEPQQTFLDPLNPQSRWSEPLLRLCQGTLLYDPAYRARLERHYRMVKDALADPMHPIHRRIAAGGRRAPAARPEITVEPYAPCPCGSGEKYKFCCRDKTR